MAKYTITMSCGHEEVHVLFGKSEDRERKIASYEKYGLCNDCYSKKIEKESEHLIQLEGTEKQVTWANKLRLDLIEKFKRSINVDGAEKETAHNYINYLIDTGMLDNDFDVYKAGTWIDNNNTYTTLLNKTMRYILRTKNQAKYYIDNRDIRELGTMTAEYLKSLRKMNIYTRRIDDV